LTIFAWAAIPTVPDEVKAELRLKADELVNMHLKPRHVEPQPKDTNWDFLTGIHTKQHKSFFYLVVNHASPPSRATGPRRTASSVPLYNAAFWQRLLEFGNAHAGWPPTAR
jgi:hypothetical protein